MLISATVICLLGITFLSVVEATRHSFGGSDKVAHAAAYGLLAFLFYWSLGTKFSWWGRALLVLGLCVGYGVLMELIQAQVGRDRDVADALANTVGAVLGTAAAAVMQTVPGLHPPHRGRSSGR